MEKYHVRMKEIELKKILKRKGDNRLTLQLIEDILLEQKHRTLFYINQARLKEIWYKENGWNKTAFSEIEWLLKNIEKPTDSKKRIPYYLTDKDVQNLIENSGKKTSIIIRFLSETGMRVTEIINIKFEDIDVLKDKIVINYNACKTNMNCSRKISKNFFYEIVSIFNGEKYLFETSNGNKNTRNGIRDLVHNAGNRILNRKIGPHSLRHYWSTKQHENGVSPYEVSRMMGHKNTGSRYEYYVHI